MKKVFLLDTKHVLVLFDASTPLLEDEAYLKAFNYLDEEESYLNLNTKEQKALYKKAKKGDKTAAKILITLRQDYEYEHFSCLEVN